LFLIQNISIMLFFYRLGLLVYHLIIIVISPFNSKANLWLKGRKDVFKKLKSTINKKEKLAWFHCASLGEFEQGRPLIEAYREKYPDHKILLTFFSPSGYEIRKNYNMADYIFYLPIDSQRNAKKFLNITNPEIVFFIKYEFWHYYLTEIGKRKIPLYLISGIFRENQRFFKWYGGSFRKVLKHFNYFFVQNTNSQDLLKSIGFSNSIITGDTRFDRVFAIAQQAKTLPLVETFKQNQQVLVLGSSWQPDEELVINYFNQAENKFKLIIAPHEVSKENINRITKNISANKIVLNYSDANTENVGNADVLIINSIGILSSVYRYGDIAYIGGGFGKGIHNILEAATFGLPIIFGPNYKKFKEAHDLIASGGAINIDDVNELKIALDSMLSDKDVVREKGKIASEYVLNNKGATKEIIEHISKYS
jgi:3-deoxy-D-manno-octulosonic-acid transferase